MKSIFLATCFFFISFTLFSQPVAIADAGSSLKAKPTTTKKAKSTAATVAAHNLIANIQISDHLQENLEYPADMTEYSLDGIVTAVVIISDAGEISQIMIAKTDLPESFQKAVTKTLRSLEKLNLKGRAYQGDNLVYVPVHFSL